MRRAVPSINFHLLALADPLETAPRHFTELASKRIRKTGNRQQRRQVLCRKNLLLLDDHAVRGRIPSSKRDSSAGRAQRRKRIRRRFAEPLLLSSRCRGRWKVPDFTAVDSVVRRVERSFDQVGGPLCRFHELAREMPHEDVGSHFVDERDVQLRALGQRPELLQELIGKDRMRERGDRQQCHLFQRLRPTGG